MTFLGLPFLQHPAMRRPVVANELDTLSLPALVRVPGASVENFLLETA